MKNNNESFGDSFQVYFVSFFGNLHETKSRQYNTSTSPRLASYKEPSSQKRK